MLVISKGIWKCDLCVGCRHNSPALPGIFPTGASVILIAQNPGEGNEEMQESFDMTYKKFMDWYRKDFFSSRASKEIAKLFDDEKWYLRYAYTNVVKCRTPSNEDPSAQMYVLCASKWLSQQLKQKRFKKIITLGYSAKKIVDIVLAKNELMSKTLNVPHYSFLARKGKSYKDYRNKAAEFIGE